MFSDDYYLKNEPNSGFSPAMAAILIFVDGEEYTSVFKEHNIGVPDLCELSDTDLIVMGVECESTRERILNAIENLPLAMKKRRTENRNTRLKSEDIGRICNETAKQLRRIYLSVTANKISLMRNKNTEDLLLTYTPKLFATDIILHTMEEMNKLLVNIEKNINVLSNMKQTQKKPRHKTRILILGGFIITVLTVSLIKSVRNL